MRVPLAFVASWIPFVLLLLTALDLGGCRSAAHRDVIVAVPLTATGPPMLTERTGLEEAAGRHHLDIDWNGPSERNAQWQVDTLQRAVRNPPYGIVITPYSAFGLNTSIRETLAKRIPTVIVAAPIQLPPSPYLSFVLEDTQAGAELVERRLNTVLKGQGKLALLGIDPESDGSDLRAEMLEDALRRSSPKLQVVDRVRGPMSFGYLEISAEDMLKRHPDLDAIVTFTARAGVSAAEAIRRIRPVHPVRLIIYDGTFADFLLLRHHEADAILVQDLRAMGRLAVENIVADREGSPVRRSVMAPPKLATRENVDTEAIQQMMLQHWDDQ